MDISVGQIVEEILYVAHRGSWVGKYIKFVYGDFLRKRLKYIVEELSISEIEASILVALLFERSVCKRLAQLASQFWKDDSVERLSIELELNDSLRDGKLSKFIFLREDDTYGLKEEYRNTILKLFSKFDELNP